MRADRVTEQQLVKSISSILTKLGVGSSGGPIGALEERAARDYYARVGVILINQDSEIFVGRRHTKVETWQMPQGSIGRGEDPRAAAFRELKNQLGTDNAEIIAENKSWLYYDLPVGLTGRVRRRGRRGQRQKWFAMRFKGRDVEINIETEKAEFCDWKWVSIAELTKLIAPFKRLVYLSALEEFFDAIGPYNDQSCNEEPSG